MTAGSNFKSAADLTESLLHSEYAQPAVPRLTGPKVYDLQYHLARLLVQTNDGIATSRMKKNVRESFLRNTKQMSLNLPRQTSNLCVCFKFNMDAAALREVVYVRA